MRSNCSNRPSEFHRYRISVIETWPESVWKQSALESARAAFARELNYERTFPMRSRNIAGPANTGADNV